MFPGVRDPVGPAVAFWMAHVLLFPVEMPTEKGCLVGASCTPSSRWPSRGRGSKPVHMEEVLHHPVPQDPSCLFPPPILQPLTQLTWRLQHPGDTPIPRGKHPHYAWLTPQQQSQSPAQGMEETVLQVGGF